MTPERLAEMERWADSPPLAELKLSKAEEGWIHSCKNTAKVLIAHIHDLEAQLAAAREATIRDWWAQVCERAEAKMLQTGKLEGSHYAAATELLATATPPSLSAKERQRRSFAYGNVHIDNPNVTREMVDRAAERLASEPPSPEVGE